MVRGTPGSMEPDNTPYRRCVTSGGLNLSIEPSQWP
jgi:hypothetical protein